MFVEIKPTERDMDMGEPKTIPYENYPYHVSMRKGHEPKNNSLLGCYDPRIIDLTEYHKWAEKHGLDMRHSLMICGSSEDYKHRIGLFFSKKSEAMFFKLVWYKSEEY